MSLQIGYFRVYFGNNKELPAPFQRQDHIKMSKTRYSFISSKHHPPKFYGTWENLILLSSFLSSYSNRPTSKSKSFRFLYFLGSYLQHSLSFFSLWSSRLGYHKFYSTAFTVSANSDHWTFFLNVVFPRNWIHLQKPYITPTL